MKKKLLIILPLIILLNSCGCIKMELTEEERNWCSYKKNDYLIFQSNLGNIDTIQVTDRNENYTNKDCNNIEISYYQLNYINLTLMLKSKTKSVLISEIFLQKNQEGKDSHPEISIFGLTSDFPENGHRAAKKKVKLKKTNKTYHNAYCFIDKISATNIESGYLDSFYYDQKFGLIKYTAKDGESFELIKRL